MTITVTQEHIKVGVPFSKWGCAVALAAYQRLGPCYVGETAIVLLKDNQVFHLPPVAQLWIQRFDRGLPVEPFSFDV